MRMLRRSYRIRGSEKNLLPPANGQAAVEFALTILVVLFVVFGAIELIMLMYTYVVLAESAKEGVRYAIVHGSNNSLPSGPVCPCLAIDGPTGVVKNTAKWSLHDTSTMTVTVTYLDNAGGAAVNVKPPTMVRVVVSYPYQPFFSFGWTALTVRAAAEGRIMN